MKTRIFLAVVAMLGLVGACEQPQPINMTQAVKSARTSEDHNALAKRYEEAASQMQAKAHCRGLIRYYEQAAEANREMAEIHREIAAETK